MFWPFTLWINCSSDLKHFFLTVGQNNFGNKIPLSLLYKQSWKNIRPLMPTKDFEGLKKSTRSMKSTQVYEFQTYILSSYWFVIYFLCIHNPVFRGHTTKLVVPINILLSYPLYLIINCSIKTCYFYHIMNTLVSNMPVQVVQISIFHFSMSQNSISEKNQTPWTIQVVSVKVWLWKHSQIQKIVFFTS